MKLSLEKTGRHVESHPIKFGTIAKNCGPKVGAIGSLSWLVQIVTAIRQAAVGIILGWIGATIMTMLKVGITNPEECSVLKKHFLIKRAVLKARSMKTAAREIHTAFEAA
jgi:hypothetical protein